MTSKQAIKLRIALNSDDGEKVHDEDTADYVNNYFATIGPRLAAKFPINTQTNRDTNTTINELIPEFTFTTVTENMILKQN